MWSDRVKSSLFFRIAREAAPAILFFALAVIPFWIPLFEGFGAVEWDAREVHLTNLIFSSQAWQAGHMPLWTPYIFSGFPQIADMQVAVFYPPTLLIGLFSVFTQELLLWQTVFHFALAGFGMYLFVRRIARVPIAGIFAGVVYMFSGFMIGHASHIGMHATAAWIPIVFLLVHITLEKKEWFWACAMGVAAGTAILAGHFQTAVFMLFAVFLYAACMIAITWRRERSFPLKQCALMACAVVMMTLISAVQLIPTFELTAESQRAEISLELAQTESLAPDSLWGLIAANHNNAAFGDYAGPWDRTQNYLFLGITTLFLALTALLTEWKTSRRWMTLFFAGLAGIGVLYALGAYGFLHKYFYLLPLFNKMRAPSNMMIVFDVAIIALAGVGLAGISRISKKAKIFSIVIVVVLAAELLPYAITSELIYARKDPVTVFEKPWIVQNTEREYAALAPINRFRLYRVPELERNLAQVFSLYDFGGYNPLALKRQAAYEDAMVRNQSLIDLGGIKYLPCEYIASRAAEMQKVGNLCINDAYLPRAFVVNDYVVARDADDALAQLGAIDVRRTAVLEKEPPLGARSGGHGDIVRYEETQNRIAMTVRADVPSLVLISQTYYPGWRAAVNGVETEIFRADYLYQAAFVPEGESEIVLIFHSDSLKKGLIVSIIGIILFLVFAGYKGMRMFFRRDHA